MALAAVTARWGTSRDEAVRRLLAEYVRAQEDREPEDRLTHISTMLRYSPLPLGRRTPRAGRPLRLRAPPVCWSGSAPHPDQLGLHPQERRCLAAPSATGPGRRVSGSVTRLCRTRPDPPARRRPAPARKGKPFGGRRIGYRETGKVLELVEAALQGLHDKGLLVSDYRGETLDEVLQRFTESSGSARPRGRSARQLEQGPRRGRAPRVQRRARSAGAGADGRELRPRQASCDRLRATRVEGPAGVEGPSLRSVMASRGVV